MVTGIILAIAGLMTTCVHVLDRETKALTVRAAAYEHEECDKLLGLAHTSLDSVTILSKWGHCLKYVPVPQVVDEQPVRLR